MTPNDLDLYTLNAQSAAVDTLLHQLAGEDLLGQLLRRAGRMAELGSEGGDPKLDWVDGVEKILANPGWLVACEQEALDILQLGIRHVIWAGMGGSVQTVYVLKRMGFLDTPNLHVYPCDSTDPASLNRILMEILDNDTETRRHGDAAISGEELRSVLSRTMMLGVSMGMTSEEPITHLEWFDGLLEEFQIPDRQSHLQVMTLPDSYLDQFAQPRGCKMVPIQLDAENHTGGRMSAPATRVFVRPVALRVIADALSRDATYTPDGSLLRAVLERTQEFYGVSHAMSADERALFIQSDQFVRLGALISERVNAGKNHVALVTPSDWDGFAPWLEQLVEESLGKGGKGFVLFYGDQNWESLMTAPLILDLAPLSSTAGESPGTRVFMRVPPADSVVEQLGQLGGLFAGFKLTIATFGYLQNIVFAGQPAVEAYKAYARKFREAEGDVPFPAEGAGFRSLTIHPFATTDNAVEALVALFNHAKPLRYLDFTFNGEMTDALRDVFAYARRSLANETLRIPAKIRTGPSDYHSTEQSEVDGPNELISIRLVARKHEPVAAGSYTDKFLLAQARGTWQAMEDAGRCVLMIAMPELNDRALADLRGLFVAVRQRLSE